MLGHPQRLEAALLAGARQVGDRERARSDEHENAELHGSASVYFLASAGRAAFAFWKCSTASSWRPFLSASSPALYSSPATPRSRPSCCAFLMIGSSSFLSSVTDWAPP